MDEKVKINEHEVWWDDQLECGCFTVNGVLEPDEAVESIVAMAKVSSDCKRKVILMDLSNMEGDMSRETRQAVSSMEIQKKTEKIAVVGSNSITRMIAKVLLSSINESEIAKFFQTREEALAWLKII